MLTFQSPSRWGRCCICSSAEDDASTAAVFQSPSRWGRCCIGAGSGTLGSGTCRFQSPSRWGRCCIAASDRHAPCTCTRVSVPFSMGTVLHLHRCRDAATVLLRVSVPFSMGTVLHPSVPMTWHRAARNRFSPLLDGDGVASVDGSCSMLVSILVFQSPSRWGRCCIASASHRRRHGAADVSVPFSMGTVLHPLLNSSHSTTLTARSGSPFLADSVSASKQPPICEFCRYHTSPQ